MPPPPATRGLLSVLERGENGSWAPTRKGIDEFTDVTVDDDILLGFNAMVSRTPCPAASTCPTQPNPSHDLDFPFESRR